MILDSRSFPLSEAQLLQLASYYADEPGTVLLYSGGASDCAESSFLCLFPDQVISLESSFDAWETLESQLRCEGEHDFPEWVGYLGYEMGAYADPDMPISHGRSPIPDALFYRPAVVIRYDHREKRASVRVREDALTGEQRRWRDNIGKEGESAPLPQWTAAAGESRKSYFQKIAQIKEWIRGGEMYQLNLSQTFTYWGSCRPFSLFERWTCKNPAPFSAYLQGGNFSIVSASPERFLRLRDSALETRPIKGTAPRGKSPEEDKEMLRQLLMSEKERAELIMITDLMRNDLAKVSLTGSVTAEKVLEPASYPDVHHLYSLITSRPDPRHSSLSLLRSCFPGGSITGCPKLRAMELIYQLEQRPRGIYTGAIGYFTGKGEFDFSIAIRTLTVDSEKVQVSLGGGITLDSDPDSEYQETLNKGASLFQILNIS